MDQEDGVIWVYGPSEDSVMAFTDFGIETLVDLIEIHKAKPDILKPPVDPQSLPRPTPHAYKSAGT